MGLPHNPVFQYTVIVDDKLYGPASGTNKAEAKGNAAILACDANKIYHTGVLTKGLSILFLVWLLCFSII